MLQVYVTIRFVHIILCKRDPHTYSTKLNDNINKRVLHWYNYNL